MLDLFDINQIEESKPKKEKKHSDDKKYIGLDRDIYLKKKELDSLINLQENIRKSERLRAKITKALSNGESKDLILKDCLEVIGLMTGDKVFYKQNLEKIKDRA